MQDTTITLDGTTESEPAIRQVDTVVFDLGGVLLNWNPRYLYRSIFADEAKMEWFLSEVTHHDWNVAQDAGRTWDEAVAEAIARHPDWEREIRAYRERWHEMIPDAIEGTVAILERLHAGGVPLYAITNFAADTFMEARDRFPFLQRFRDVVVSAAERVLKPDPRIYRILAERNALDLARCVFIDDVEKNVAGARAVGMEAIHFVGPEDLETRLRALGVLAD
ncbi:HAD family hydrolase [Prosthecomicrobium sp. N25]|uniref:HAD family hydrolase n=1 Tax=Prosthecomicrobium sp. N25 TaxID=3129254 RepID=UPI003078367A